MKKSKKEELLIAERMISNELEFLILVENYGLESVIDMYSNGTENKYIDKMLRDYALENNLGKLVDNDV